MTLSEQAATVVYVLIAAILSMVIGMERERRDKPAGVRTHMLVGVGACLFTSLGLLAFPNADQSRVAASIVTGIGFLGAGVIWKGSRTGHDDQEVVHELTTAASIWVTAAVGMAMGVGAWFLAFAITVLVWTILAILRKLPVRHQ